MAAIQAVAREAGLPVHLDGARLFNAAAYLDVPLGEICQHVDSVWFALCKGLGGPVGAILAGDADFMTKARRAAKMLGGGMRQAGSDRGARDRRAARIPTRVHRRDHAAGAASWRGGLPRSMPSLVDVDRVQTNIVNCFVDRFAGDAGRHQSRAARARRPRQHKRTKIRFVTHYHIDEAAVDAAVQRVRRGDRVVAEGGVMTIAPATRLAIRDAGSGLLRRATNCIASSSRRCSEALERSGFDAFLFFKAEAVRYITDFYVKGFRPFMEPEYVVLVAKGQPAGRRLHLGQRRPAHPIQVRHRGCPQAAARCQTGLRPSAG